MPAQSTSRNYRTPLHDRASPTACSKPAPQHCHNTGPIMQREHEAFIGLCDFPNTIQSFSSGNDREEDPSEISIVYYLGLLILAASSPLPWKGVTFEAKPQFLTFGETAGDQLQCHSWPLPCTASLRQNIGQSGFDRTHAQKCWIQNLSCSGRSGSEVLLAKGVSAESKSQVVDELWDLPDRPCFTDDLAWGKERREVWKAGAGRSKSWRRGSPKRMSKTQKSHTIHHSLDRFIPTTFLKSRTKPPVCPYESSAGKAHRVSMTPNKNAHAKNTLQSMKSPHRHRKLVDMSLELGSTYQGIAAMVGTSLRVVFDLDKLEANVVTLTSTEFSSSNQPVGSRSKISTPRYYFGETHSKSWLSALTYWKERECWLQPAARRDRISSLPDYYKALSAPGKRRARKARLKQTLTIEARTQPDNAHEKRAKADHIAKRLQAWRKKKLKQGKDPFRKCYRYYQVHVCGHGSRVLCPTCAHSWKIGVAYPCELEVVSRGLKDAIRIFSSPCGSRSCLQYSIRSGLSEARQRYNVLKKVPLWHWMLTGRPFENIAEQSVVPTHFFTDAQFDVLARVYGCVADEEKEKQVEVADEEKEKQAEQAPNNSWGPELLPWEELVANHRDFRRPS